MNTIAGASCWRAINPEHNIPEAPAVIILGKCTSSGRG